MFLAARTRVLAAVVSASMVFAFGAAAEDAPAPKKEGATPQAYSGTFSDSAGHKGPLECQLTPGQGNAWACKVHASNQGTPPNRSADFNFDLTGQKEGETLKLTGTPSIGRPGTYDLTMVVTDKTVEATFKKSDGKSNGTFSLTAGAPAK